MICFVSMVYLSVLKWIIRLGYYDVGVSGKCFYNARILGINSNEISSLVLSHGHRDHTGGVEEFKGLSKKLDSPFLLFLLG